MQVFVHYKIQQLENFFEQLSRLNQLHYEKSFQFGRLLTTFFDQTIAYFNQIGDASNKSEIERLRNYFSIAESGIDPEHLKKVLTEKRLMKRTSAFYCLSQITGLLQDEMQKEKQKLEFTKESLGPLVLSLVQAGIITETELSQELTQTQIRELWDRISQNDQVKLHERNFRLKITQEDVLLLFEDILDSIKK